VGERPIYVSYYSDILCVWAYVAEVRLEELRTQFQQNVTIEYRFVSIFGNARARVGERWRDRGGFEGYASHVQQVVAGFNHVEIHPKVWTSQLTAGSLSPHVFAKAVGLLAQAGTIDNSAVESYALRTPAEELIWRLRVAFFRDLEDVGRLDVQLALAERLGLPGDAIRQLIDDGSAQAVVAEDLDAAQRQGVTGSPTYLLNEGRQKLYGNVGYRILEANVHELLQDDRDSASWC
jgi:predicted DsbA family dithiol-disulfide isomerase